MMKDHPLRSAARGCYPKNKGEREMNNRVYIYLPLVRRYDSNLASKVKKTM